MARKYLRKYLSVVMACIFYTSYLAMYSLLWRMRPAEGCSYVRSLVGGLMEQPCSTGAKLVSNLYSVAGIAFSIGMLLWFRSYMSKPKNRKK